MRNSVISPSEAWEEVERRKAAVNWNTVTESWCASAPGDKWELGWGATPIEAVGNLLARIGEAANKTEESACQGK